jgi:hypothetical protein
MASSYLGRMLRLPVPGQPVLAPPRWLMRRPEAGELAPGGGFARPAEAAPPDVDLGVARRPAPPAAVRWEGTDEALAGPSAAGAEDDVAGRRPAARPAPPPRPAVATPPAIAGPGTAPRPAGVPRHAARWTGNAAASGTPGVGRGMPNGTTRTGAQAVPEGVGAGPATTFAAAAVPAAAEHPSGLAPATARHGGAMPVSRPGASQPADASEPGATNPRPARAPTAGPAAVRPAAPTPQAPPRAARDERESGVRIGTIEVVVTPPLPAAAPGPTASSLGRHAAARAAARLSRGFPSGFGLRQG